MPTKKELWYEDVDVVASLTKGLIDDTYASLAARSQSSALFPGGITHVKLGLKVSPTEGFSMEMDVQGPDCPCREGESAPLVGCQLTPTAVWWFGVGTNNPFLKVLSVGTTAIPGTNWGVNQEHWLIDKTIGESGQPDLKDIIAGNTLEVSINHHTVGAPSKDLIDEAGKLEDTSLWRFQASCKGLLATTDWTAVPGGGPPYNGGSLYYFDEGGTDLKRARLLLELSTDKKNLARITWLTQDTYDAYSSDFTLVPAALPTSWTGWNYYSTATGY